MHDEILSVLPREGRNLKPEVRGTAGVGDMWTWTAIDPDSKLMVTWHLGKRTKDDANAFIFDLRAAHPLQSVQITTDGFATCPQSPNSALVWPTRRPWLRG